MRYVQQVLQPGEVVRHTGSLHWTIYLPGLLFTLAALVTIGWAEWGAGGNMFASARHSVRHRRLDPVDS